jgi:CBS domain containing-hemolysin-like protein
VSIDVNASIDTLYHKFIDTGLSKIMVYDEDPDQIVGYVHQKEMFRHPRNIRSMLIPVEISTETMNVTELLNKFSRSHKSISLVVDELGSAAGIVTLEDIMEEIFGEIEDEHDTEELIEEKTGKFEYRFSARHEIDYLNDKYELDLPVADYHTLGGYIIARHESIPRPGEKVLIDRFEFVIESVKNTRIETVRLLVVGNNES